jgi:hypothetical protein
MDNHNIHVTPTVPDYFKGNETVMLFVPHTSHMLQTPRSNSFWSLKA